MDDMRDEKGRYIKGFISPKRNGETRICYCGNQFYISGYRINDKKRGKFCSRKCGDKMRKGKHNSIKTEFKKDQIPYIAEHPEIAPRDANHFNWKGDKVGYGALHAWIKRRLAKPMACNHCGEIKSLDLANKSHLYKRELNDWLWLCKKCHTKYDDSVNKSWITRRINK